MSAGRHFKFISKTVLVKNNDIDTALLLLHRIMKEDKVMQQIRYRMNGYEPPWMKRQRLSYERCKRLYTVEMERKVKLVLKKIDQIPGYGDASSFMISHLAGGGIPGVIQWL